MCIIMPRLGGFDAQCPCALRGSTAHVWRAARPDIRVLKISQHSWKSYLVVDMDHQYLSHWNSELD